MLDDDAVFNLAGVPLKGGQRGVPPGYTAFPKGRGTYHAREHLKALGGYWKPDEKIWLVPSHNADEARRLIREAEAGRLSSDVPPPPKTADASVVTCWECGERKYIREIVARGGDPATFYCGCAEVAMDARARRAVRG